MYREMKEALHFFKERLKGTTVADLDLKILKMRFGEKGTTVISLFRG